MLKQGGQSAETELYEKKLVQVRPYVYIFKLNNIKTLTLLPF